MAKKPFPTPDELRQLLAYDPQTGSLTWRHRPMSMFSSERYWKIWNKRYANTPALHRIDPRGYRGGSLAGTTVTAHRVAFAIHNGYWPEGMVDHINMDKLDNSAANLREATRAQNGQNRKPVEGSSSRFLGVSRGKTRGTWSAKIGRRDPATGKSVPIYLGTFRVEEDAARAYDQAARELLGQYARLNLPHG